MPSQFTGKEAPTSPTSPGQPIHTAFRLSKTGDKAETRPPGLIPHVVVVPAVSRSTGSRFATTTRSKSPIAAGYPRNDIGGPCTKPSPPASMVACKQDNPAVVTPQRCRSPQTRLPKEHYTCDRRQLMGTYCYLCAYGTKRVPPKSHRLPSGSGAQPTDELASCHGCGVLACSQHGHRVSLFKCALCDGVD